MTRFVPALLLSLPLWVAACATSNSTQMAEVPGPSSGPNAVKEVGEVQNANVSVRLQRYDGGDLFEFTVKNLSAEPLVVDRDAVEMLSPTGARLLRLPGGTEAAYQVPSAGVHRVNLRFDMQDVTRGELVRFDFSRALQVVGGGTIAMAPLVVKYY